MVYNIESSQKQEKRFKAVSNGRFDDSSMNEIATIIITK